MVSVATKHKPKEGPSAAFGQSFYQLQGKKFGTNNELSSEQHAKQPLINQPESASPETMQRELDKLLMQVENTEYWSSFKDDLNAFFGLYCRFLSDKIKIDWNEIKSPSEEQIISYSALKKADESVATSKACLEKLAVIKLNGGLGTSMGCVGPKSAIDVRDNLSFLDLTVMQIESFNQDNNISIPLILMNSFNTDEETKKIIQKFSNRNIEITTFNQSRFPRIEKESLTPAPLTPFAEKKFWYPPGHGDLYRAIDKCGLLDKLIEDGKEYLFICNVDNLGATIDQHILQYIDREQIEFLMEVTDKTMADVKGGTLINSNGSLKLLEVAQVPSDKLSEFTSIKKFKIFNTNNIWIKTRALKDALVSKDFNLEVIVNPKSIENDGRKVIQLETAIGSAIQHFKKSIAVNVPRTRFLPVKNCSDLFLLQSDLYLLSKGTLTLNPRRPFPSVPIIKLGDGFKKISHFLSRFATPPKILELNHLTVMGDVYFGADVTLKGTVIIVANGGSKIDIPAGSILEDKVVSGNLCIMDH